MPFVDLQKVIVMQFGRVTEEELNSIYFSLPTGPAFNKTILSGKKNKAPTVYQGCAKMGKARMGRKNLSPA